MCLHNNLFYVIMFLVMELEYILSQIFVILSYAMLGTTYLLSNRKQILIFSLLSLVFNGVQYIFLSAWSGLAMVGVAIIRNIIFLVQNKVRKTENSNKITWVDWLILAVLYIISIVSAMFTYDGIFSMLSVIATMVYTLSVWQKNVKVYRILGIVSSVIWVGYGVFIKSIFAIILELVVLIVEIVSVVKEKIKNKKQVGENNGKS